MARAIVKNFGQPVKNYIVNGGMTVAQRGVINAANNNFLYGGCDRFAVGPFFAGGSSGGQIAQQTFTTGVLTQQMQAVVTLSNTGAGSVQFYTRLEARDVARLNGKTVTWSMLAYQTSGLTLQFGAEINRPTSSADNYGALTGITSFSSVSVPSHTLTRVSFTYTFGATDAEKGLEMRTYFSVPSTLSNKGYYIGEMQLEESSYMSQLEMVNYQVELDRCKRYYQRISRAGEMYPCGNGSVNNITEFSIPYGVEMRTAPTLTADQVGNNWRVWSNSAGAAFYFALTDGSTTFNSTSPVKTIVSVTMTNPTSTFISGTALNAGGFIDASAEL